MLIPWIPLASICKLPIVGKLHSIGKLPIEAKGIQGTYRLKGLPVYGVTLVIPIALIGSYLFIFTV